MRKSRRDLIGCPDFHRTLAMSRRGFLRAGALGLTGLTLSQLLRIEAGAAEPKRQNSVIILWMRGGPAQHETWDPKPDAPAEYRGEFGAIRTAVPGIQLCEYLPLSAKVMGKWSIVRSLHHADAGHSSGDQICFTGYPAGTNPDLNVYPSCGSVVARQLQEQDPSLPAYVMVPRMVPGTDAAYLGRKYRPFETNADPATPGKFVVPNVSPAEGISVDRLHDRRALLEGLDRTRRDADGGGQLEAADKFRQRAWDLLTSSKAR